MTKTALDVGTRALRLAGRTPWGQAAEAEDYAIAEETYTALLAEFSEARGMAFEWGEDAVPDTLFLPLAGIVAMRLPGSGYDGRQEWKDLYAYVFPDDRVEPARVDYF
tara:strand:- start:23621 stop:23944 length:324 start_codon:yes stop_codon:yes gene_type:complete